MNAECRYVFDTNAPVDALCFSGSFGRKAFDIVRVRGTFNGSLETVAEFVEVMHRPRLKRYVTEDELKSFMTGLSLHMVLVDPTERIAACRDPKDDKFLELAVAGAASAIITRDAELLILSPFRNIEIVEPQTFVERHQAP